LAKQKLYAAILCIARTFLAMTLCHSGLPALSFRPPGRNPLSRYGSRTDPETSLPAGKAGSGMTSSEPVAYSSLSPTPVYFLSFTCFLFSLPGDYTASLHKNEHYRILFTVVRKPKMDITGRQQKTIESFYE
jgi:hypothetical protein